LVTAQNEKRPSDKLSTSALPAPFILSQAN